MSIMSGEHGAPGRADDFGELRRRFPVANMNREKADLGIA